MATSNQNSNTDNSFLGDSNAQNPINDQPQTVDLGAVTQASNPSDAVTTVEPLAQPVTPEVEALAQPVAPEVEALAQPMTPSVDPLAQLVATEATQGPVVTIGEEVNAQGFAMDTSQAPPVEDTNTEALSGYNIPGITPDESTEQATPVMPEAQVTTESAPVVPESLTDEVVKAADPLSMQGQSLPVEPSTPELNTDVVSDPPTLGAESAAVQPGNNIDMAASIEFNTVENGGEDIIQTNLAPGVEPLAVDSNAPDQSDFPVMETSVNEPKTGNTLADLTEGIEAPQVDAGATVMDNNANTINPVSEAATQTTLEQTPIMTTEPVANSEPAAIVDNNIPSVDSASAVLDQLIPNATENTLPPLNGADNQVKKKAKGSSRIGLIILILLFFLVGVVLLLLGLYLSPAIDIEIPVVNDIFSSLGL